MRLFMKRENFLQSHPNRVQINLDIAGIFLGSYKYLNFNGQVLNSVANQEFTSLENFCKNCIETNYFSVFATKKLPHYSKPYYLSLLIGEKNLHCIKAYLHSV